MHLVCPHCRNAIEVIEESGGEEVVCPSCGSSFHLESPSTISWTPPSGQRQLGRFMLIDQVGVGAFGTVFKARDPELDRIVAIKVPRPGNLATPADLDRFVREARSVAQLQHASIVPIHEVGHSEGLPFLVSDFVQGMTLADRLSAGRLRVDESVNLIITLAEALDYAHSHGVVHRDVKPSNILIDETGSPRLMDFGLAKREAGEITITLDGQVIGTPAYMSPEQATGKSHEVDGRSDIYSLGVIFYQLLTGELPFRGTKRMLIYQVVHDEPRQPRALNERIPRDLETICLKAMAKDPSRRYDTGRELAADLGRWQRGESILARPVGRTERLWRWTRRNPGIAALSASVLTLLLIVAIVSTTAAIRIYALRVESEQAQRERAMAQVEALLDADSSAVRSIIEGLEPFREWVNPRLRELAAEERSPRRLRRVKLALLPVDPSQATGLFDHMLQSEPDELLVIRDSLSPWKEDFVADLWQLAESSETASELRFRAACALAAFDPDSPRWPEIAPVVAAQLTDENPLFVGTWQSVLRPVLPQLYDPLLSISQDATKNETERLIATSVLLDYASQTPETLAGLLMDSAPNQFPTVFAKFESYGNSAIPLLTAELIREPEAMVPEWRDELDPDWPSADPRYVKLMATHHGMLTEHFAFCQDMPLAIFLEAVEGLRPCGYYPLRVRPFGDGADVRIAAIWRRSARYSDWRLETGLTAQTVHAMDAELRKDGFFPLEVATYRARPSNATGTLHFAAVWLKSRHDDVSVQRAILAGVPRDQMEQDIEELKRKGLVPLRLHTILDDDGTVRVSGTWGRGRQGVTITTLEDENKLFTPGDSVEGVQQDICFRREWYLPDYPDYATQAARANSILGDAPDDATARLQRAEAAFYLGDSQQAIDDTTFLIDADTATPDEWYYRAIASARLARIDEARDDLLTFSLRTLVDPIGSRRKFALSVIIAAYSGDTDVSTEPLDEALRAAEGQPEMLYSTASAYAMLAHLVGQEDSTRSAEYAQRAAELLLQSPHHTSRFVARLHVDPEMAALRNHPDLSETLSGRQWQYDAIWSTDRQLFVSRELRGLSVEEHLQQSNQMLTEGYRPQAISVDWVRSPNDGRNVRELVGASVWERPATSDLHAGHWPKRKANAAVALLTLGRADLVWPLLKHAPDPSLQSFLTHRFGSLGADPELLIERLEQETDDGIRHALILALGEFDERQLSASRRERLVPTLLTIYRQAADAGVHSGADWLLRRWDFTDRVQAMQRELVAEGQAPGRRWYMTSEGHTMSIINGPVEFLMGSPADEFGRYANERQHRRQIPRSYAIATKHVTAEQIQRFLRANPNFRIVVGTDEIERSPQNPAVGLGWLETAAYFRWLSEQEGIPEDQMCFPPIPQITSNMKLPSDYLTRTGYRHPTEAEWEYACRAGTVTSRFVGDAEELLGYYARYLNNSDLRVGPPGLFKPNRFGLFDMLGNEQELCLQYLEDYPSDITALHVDRETIAFVDTSQRVVTRGGRFLSSAPDIRSARRTSQTLSTFGGCMIRVARTFPSFAISSPGYVLRNELELELTGLEISFSIRRVNGVIQVTPEVGEVPAVLRITGENEKPTEFSLVVERSDTQETTEITGILSAPWDIRYFAYDWANDDWDTVRSGEPLYSATASQIDFDLAANQPPREQVPATDFALIGETELNVHGGEYMIRTEAKHGIRVFLNDEIMIDNWHPAALVQEDLRHVQLSKGTHTVRVEYFQGAGPARLCVELRPFPKITEVGQ